MNIRIKMTNCRRKRAHSGIQLKTEGLYLVTLPNINKNVVSNIELKTFISLKHPVYTPVRQIIIYYVTKCWIINDIYKE